MDTMNPNNKNGPINKQGVSPNFWGRAMGWYGMGLVDVLGKFPDDQPQKKRTDQYFKPLCGSSKKCPG